MLTKWQKALSLKCSWQNATGKENMKRTLKGIRNDLNLTQKEMAEKMGMGVQTWRNKELYVTELTATELMLLCNLAKIEPTDVKLSN